MHAVTNAAPSAETFTASGIARTPPNPTEVLIATAGVVAFAVTASTKWVWYGGSVAFSLCAVVLVIALVAGPGDAPWLTRLRDWLTVRPIVFIGRVSYALYLWHFMVLVITLQVVGLQRSGWLVTKVLVVMVSFGMAVASYYLVERPFLRRKWRLARTTTHDAGIG